MRRALLLVIVFTSLRVVAQPLVCAPNSAASGKPCDVFHFHVEAYNPETKAFVPLSGVNSFASMSACERAREARMKRNAPVVDYVKRVRAQPYEADRVSPSCHCDMTTHAASATFLSDAQRLAQHRSAEDVRRRVRERLLDLDLPADSELLAGLAAVSAVNPMLSTPRLMPLPAAVSTAVENLPAELRMPRPSQANASATAVIELPLAEIPISGAAGAPTRASTALASTPTPASPAKSDRGTPASASPLSAVEQVVQVEAAVERAPVAEQPPAIVPPADAAPPPAAVAEDQPDVPADGAADVFVTHETQRIQFVIKAVSDTADDTADAVIEACRMRMQVLANLKYLILGSGARSTVAASARRAVDDPTRIDFVRRLFGSDVAAHWIPRVTTDVLLPANAAVDENPERVLRDSSDRFDGEQKRRALYVMLTRDSLTEEQQLWLIPTAEQFLK